MCLLVDTLRPDEEREVLARRGFLNVVNPLFVDRYYRLDLSVWDEREMSKILIRLVRKKNARKIALEYRRHPREDWSFTKTTKPLVGAVRIVTIQHL